MTFSWTKAVTLLAIVGLGLTACTQVKPIVPFETDITLSAPATVIRGGTEFEFSARLSYRDENGETQPLANQTLRFEANEFDVPDEAQTDAGGHVRFTVHAPMLPERERERDAWIRTSFGGAVVEFADKIGRFQDERTDRYFKIEQQAPGLNPPGLPGSE